MAEAADVIVVGAGNAALCAALAAREGGRSVLAIEKAPEHLRGGNTYFTGGAIRFAYEGIDDVRELVPDLSDAELAVLEVGEYPERKYFDDLMRVTEGLSDQEMANALVRGSFPTMRWLYDQGIRFVPSWSHQAFKDGEVYRFWGGLCLEAVGAGKGLSDQLFAVAQERGVEVRYDTAAVPPLGYRPPPPVRPPRPASLARPAAATAHPTRSRRGLLHDGAGAVCSTFCLISIRAAPRLRPR